MGPVCSSVGEDRKRRNGGRGLRPLLPHARRAQDPAYAEIKASLKKQLEDYQRRTADPRATGKMDLSNETREFVIKRKERGYKD